MKFTRTRRMRRDLSGGVLVPEGTFVPGDRRAEFRQTTHQHAVMKFRNSSMICDLVDLSETGAKIQILDGAVPNIEERVTLTLFDGTPVHCYVSWVEKNHIGVEFCDPVSDVSERLDFEDLGREYFGKAVTLQKSARRS